MKNFINLFVFLSFFGCIVSFHLNAAKNELPIVSSESKESMLRDGSSGSLLDVRASSPDSDEEEGKELKKDQALDDAEKVEREVKEALEKFKSAASEKIKTCVALSMKVLSGDLKELPAVDEDKVMFNERNFKEEVEFLFDQFKGIRQGSTQWRSLNLGLDVIFQETGKSRKLHVGDFFRDIIQGLMTLLSPLINFNKSSKIEAKTSELFKNKALFEKSENLKMNHFIHSQVTKLRQEVIGLFARLKQAILEKTGMISSYTVDLNDPFILGDDHNQAAQLLSEKVGTLKSDFDRDIKSFEDRSKKQLGQYQSMVKDKLRDMSEVKSPSKLERFASRLKLSPKRENSVDVDCELLKQHKHSLAEAVKKLETFFGEKQQILLGRLIGIDAVVESFGDFEIFVMKDKNIREAINVKMEADFQRMKKDLESLTQEYHAFMRQLYQEHVHVLHKGRIKELLGL